MEPLGLDDAGQQRLREWLTRGPDLGAIYRVQELLDDVAWQRPSGRYSEPDVENPGDVVYVPWPRLAVTIRPHSDEDPERLFSITSIVTVAEY